jgi:GNAT superfamily N-acetyltransferase
MSPRLAFRPVTRETADDFVALFEAPGGPKYCWCMVWRISKEEGRNTPGKARKPFMLKRIASGMPVGLVGYLDDTPRAWVSIAPKNTYERLGGPAEGPNDTVWSLACMFVHKSLRGQGLAHELIAAAIDHARRAGATIVEAYPVAESAPSYRFMGFVSAFERAGFHFVEMAGIRRHVMRLIIA